MQSNSLAARPASDTRTRLIHCYCYFCLVLSFPWMVWGTSGWFGLLLHFPIAAGGAWLLEKALRRRPFPGHKP